MLYRGCEELPILSLGLLLEGKPHSSHFGSLFLDRFTKKPGSRKRDYLSLGAWFKGLVSVTVPMGFISLDSGVLDQFHPKCKICHPKNSKKVIEKLSIF